MKSMSRLLCALPFALMLPAAQAGGEEALHDALKARQGKSATVVLLSGTELTGKVASLSADSVRLSELSGKEYFDAVIDLDRVQAVVFRAREN